MFHQSQIQKSIHLGEFCSQILFKVRLIKCPNSQKTEKLFDKETADCNHLSQGENTHLLCHSLIFRVITSKNS